ncbi:FecR family protein [Catalinimonas niigatensis]|uniref:FecR family protein n=1 Tax=Catalinimonas niigatensis TaxID=1397264 RepID=UPI002666CA11|nr:FecR domain-containing protein [Catalinimonas niigatensis]WPP50767.1 FecR domain-containing protein [Catalinimonas niigatensis]
MTEYQTYKAKDFVMNSSFQNWVLNREEKDVLFWENWAKAHPEKRDEIGKAKELVSALAHEQNMSDQQTEAEVWSKINQTLAETEVQRMPRTLAISWYYVAASISLLLIAALGYWTIRQQENTSHFATGFGETMNIMLPDSTLVTLNASSSLEYTDDWDEPGQDRIVWMEGEGFFDVSHRKRQKFIVLTQQAEVEVLGTRFNVSERRGNTEVILSSGKVALQLEKEKIFMEPGEKVSYNAEEKVVEKKVVNAEMLTSWRNNQLIFDGTPISEIAQVLEDNYGYVVRMENEAMGDLLFSGTIKADQVDLLLQALAETHSINIMKQDNILIFKLH